MYADCDLDSAVYDLTRAINLNPAKGKAYYDRGLVWLRKGDLARAKADIDKAHRLDPESFPTVAKALSGPHPPACPRATPKR